MASPIIVLSYLFDSVLSSYATMDCYADTAYINDWDGEHNNIQSECFVNGVEQSVHDNGKEDRRWKWRYCAQTQPVFISQFSLPQTSYDATFYMDCADYNTHSAIIGATSYHSNYKEDRVWTWYCGVLDTSNYLLTDCYDTGYINSWDATFQLYCANNGVIRKVYSYHDNVKEDRRWGFLCCRIINAPTTKPTVAPSKQPTMVPSNEPTVEPTVFPSEDPTADPTLDPTVDPTAIPTVDPTGDPTDDPTFDPTVDQTNNLTAKPTGEPTDDPTDDPIVNPTDDPTINPTNNPTINPTDEPTDDPTVNPTDEPTDETLIVEHPNTYRPTYAPSTRNTLYFACTYNDNKDLVTTYLSLSMYAQIMIDVFIFSMESMISNPVYYNEVSNTGQISNFAICNVFNVALSNQDSNCPSYSESESKNDNNDVYIAIGMVDIVASNELNQYQQWIIDILTSTDFKDTVTRNMNEKLANNIGNRRRLTEYASFNVTNIYIIDPLNHSIATTGYEYEFENKVSNDNSLSIIIICAVCAVIIIVILGSFISVTRKKQKHKIAEQGVEHVHNHDGNLEMEGLTQQLSNGEAHRQLIEWDDGNRDTDNVNRNIAEIEDAVMKTINQTLIGNEDNIGEGAIIDEINETHTEMHDEDHDNDVLQAVNETHIHASL